MELLQTLRKIRACEGEAAAQLLLEAYVMQEVAKKMEACGIEGKLMHNALAHPLAEGQSGAATGCASNGTTEKEE
jgi:hypothetical protein